MSLALKIKNRFLPKFSDNAEAGDDEDPKLVADQEHAATNANDEFDQVQDGAEKQVIDNSQLTYFSKKKLGNFCIDFGTIREKISKETIFLIET